MYILGISALYHDSAAALIKDGKIVAAAQEERFTRKKLDSSIPVNAVEYCLRQAAKNEGRENSLTGYDIEEVVYYDDPVLTMDRVIKNVSACKNDRNDLVDFSYDSLFSRKLWIEKSLRELLGTVGKKDRLLVSRHHLSHAASAFYPSPFEEAAVVTVDGVGEWTTTGIFYGRGNSLELLKRLEYPHSLGLLYSAFTYFCGFRVNFGEYKLMGLAPYGKPVYEKTIRDELIDIKQDGSFRLNLDYFDYQYGRAMTNERFASLFGGMRRKPEESITKREMNLASSIQKVTEEIILRLSKTAGEITGSKNLCLAGGVALNCVANGVIAKSGLFDSVWVQPASGDSGGALGAALALWHGKHAREREVCPDDMMQGAFLGPSFTKEYIRAFLDEKGVKYHEKENISQSIADCVKDQKVVGIFNGRMEYGPRALGHRSIIADPRSEEMQSKLNLSIKYRESFRPFAPAVMKEKASEWFETFEDTLVDQKYMLFCSDVKERFDTDFSPHDALSENEDMLLVVNRKRSPIPAVTHVDYSARVQSVDEKTNPYFYSILREFDQKTGCPVLINTSFNVRGEPIVCSPEDAFNCFMNTKMDVLVLEDVMLFKDEMPENEIRRDVYELD